MTHNEIKQGASLMYNLYGHDTPATMQDNRLGITRVVQVHNEFNDIGSVYIDLLPHVYVAEDGTFPEPGTWGGEWQIIELSKPHKKQLGKRIM